MAERSDHMVVLSDQQRHDMMAWHGNDGFRLRASLLTGLYPHAAGMTVNKMTLEPNEMTNLFNDPAHRDRIRDMAARVYTWQVRTGDTAPLPSV